MYMMCWPFGFCQLIHLFEIALYCKLLIAFVEEWELIFVDLNYYFVVTGHLKQSEMLFVITIITFEKA